MIQEKALVHGHLAKEGHVMMVTSAQRVTPAVVAYAPAPPLRAMQFASTVMGTAAVSKQDLDS